MAPHSLGSGTIRLDWSRFPSGSTPPPRRPTCRSTSCTACVARRIRQQIFLPDLQPDGRAQRAGARLRVLQGPVRPGQGRGAEGAGGRSLDDRRDRRVRAAGERRSDLFREDLLPRAGQGGRAGRTGCSPRRWRRPTRAALARYVDPWQGQLVLIRAARRRASCCTEYSRRGPFVRRDRMGDLGEDQGARARAGAAADQRVMASETFLPDRYDDNHRQRVLAMINAEGPGPGDRRSPSSPRRRPR